MDLGEGADEHRHGEVAVGDRAVAQVRAPVEDDADQEECATLTAWIKSAIPVTSGIGAREARLVIMRLDADRADEGRQQRVEVGDLLADEVEEDRARR